MIADPKRRPEDEEDPASASPPESPPTRLTSLRCG